ncbi:phosphotransferase [Catellatospora sp. NPDC049111]|uniref:phosphotransferase family protein n=1 Tax=Catellatospora sp. NPDC049111 TaxID=3155271 RepID=UPI0033C27B8E
MERRFVEHDQMAGLVREAFGAARRPVDVVRLTGGSKKGVYRLTLDDGGSMILYVWGNDENYWPDGGDDIADPFADASGADLFEASRAQIDAIGVRTPRLYLMDRSGSHHSADLALVEDVRGGTLEALLARDRRAAEAALQALGDALRAMAGQRSPHLGKVALVANGTAPQDRRPEQVVLDRAVRHLAVAAERAERMRPSKSRIEDLIRERAAAVRPREEYGLIHGELGPDHILVDGQGRPVLIDIEGAMFFDVEWEHAFTSMRFGSAYAPLRQPGLDTARLDFYRLAHSLALIEGPLRIADGDFPGREFMLSIADWHIGQVLAAAGAR